MPSRKKSETSLDTLAVLMKQGFEFLARRLDDADRRFDRVDGVLDKVSQRLQVVEKGLREFKAETRGSLRALEERAFPAALDRADLEARVSYIERKLKIESGK